jgi:hypothetical protein
MFRETRLGVKVGSHQECESIEEPTNIRNTNDNATSLVFFSGLVVFSVLSRLQSFVQFPYVPICDLSGGLQIKAIQR